MFYSGMIAALLRSVLGQSSSKMALLSSEELCSNEGPDVCAQMKCALIQLGRLCFFLLKDRLAGAG